jgi:hypothetical protein
MVIGKTKQVIGKTKQVIGKTKQGRVLGDGVARPYSENRNGDLRGGVEEGQPAVLQRNKKDVRTVHFKNRPPCGELKRGSNMCGATALPHA